MPRHASYIPHGVIPAVLLPFNDDLSIDEASFRRHLRDVVAVEGLSAPRPLHRSSSGPPPHELRSQGGFFHRHTACFAYSIRAIARAWTSSGPSASLRVRIAA